jgi:hypothetical protein
MGQLSLTYAYGPAYAHTGNPSRRGDKFVGFRVAYPQNVLQVFYGDPGIRNCGLCPVVRLPAFLGPVHVRLLSVSAVDRLFIRPIPEGTMFPSVSR